jgi:hypothetical protein
MSAEKPPRGVSPIGVPLSTIASAGAIQTCPLNGLIEPTGRSLAKVRQGPPVGPRTKARRALGMYY